MISAGSRGKCFRRSSPIRASSTAAVPKVSTPMLRGSGWPIA